MTSWDDPQFLDGCSFELLMISSWWRKKLKRYTEELPLVTSMCNGGDPIKFLNNRLRPTKWYEVMYILPTFMQQLRKCKKESNRWAIFNAKNVSRSSSIRILRVAKSWWPRAAPVAKSRIIVSTRPPIYPLSPHMDHFRNVDMRVVWTYEMESIMCIDFSYT